MYSTTSVADFSKETLVVKEEETYDAGAFERVEAEEVELLKISRHNCWLSKLCFIFAHLQPAQLGLARFGPLTSPHARGSCQFTRPGLGLPLLK